MKKFKDNLLLLVLLAVFASILLFSKDIKSSVIDSCNLWFKNLVPSMLPLYILLDLAINCGLSRNLFYLFKTNSVMLVLISLIGGTPGNAKYIKEFYQSGSISKDLGEYLLTFAYSPNPLFILAIAPNLKFAFAVLGCLYAMNFMNFLLFRPKFRDRASREATREPQPFSQVLENSISKSFSVLVLVLGIVVVYSIMNTLLKIYHLDSIFVSSLFEMTNALAIIRLAGSNFWWFTFACQFAGFSIHTQIKSILEGTDLSYRYFLLGRLVASLPFLLLAIFY